VRQNGRTRKQIFIPMIVKLVMGFWPIITVTSLVFLFAGIQIINKRILTEAQEKVRHDLNAARVIYSNKLAHIDDVVHLTANRFFIKDAYSSGDILSLKNELIRLKNEEKLDILTITDKEGTVLLRASNPSVSGDNQFNDALVHQVILYKNPVMSTMIVPKEELEKESPALVEQAYFRFIDTPRARSRVETEETAGMMLKAAAPIFDDQKNFLGVLYGGILLNRNYEIVDQVKSTVFQGMEYKGKDIGTSTIFQDDVRISTNVANVDGSRAIGTRVTEEVYNQIMSGKIWIGRAYVVNNWYIASYEPIWDINHQIIGILYVGMFEEKYRDVIRETTYTFLSITIAAMLVTLVICYFISRRLLIPINYLVSASKDLAQGNLDVKVNELTHDELQVLVDSFNSMADSLKKRDEQLKEYTTQKIMETERLALVGQLSANVAHELNNPLQGIVAFSHLLLERTTSEDPSRAFLEKIVGQANRARDIIRGLLDFSRQRKPDKTLSDVNSILRDCISLVKNQALFQNIEVIDQLRDDIPMIVVDPSQIERVFVNLIINAAEAMDGSGRLTMKTQFDSQEEMLEIQFSDTGHGISEENLDKIFDPFFTTKDIGHGTGLGLAISYGIIKSHRGSIHVESVVDKGTTFTISLPLNPSHENGEYESKG
jgi:two-component system NtrC family sensor kinase